MGRAKSSSPTIRYQGEDSSRADGDCGDELDEDPISAECFGLLTIQNK